MNKRLLVRLGTIIATGLLTLGLARPGYAASVNMYLTAPSTSVAKGHTLSVGVHVNSGSTAINAVQANLTYPTDKLDFVSIASSSAFPVESENNGGNGAIRIGRGVIGSVKDDQLIATITFKAKAVGTAEVNLATSSSATEPGNNKLVSASTTGSQYTITDEAATAQSGTSHDVTPPKITEIKVSDINYSSVKLTWKTSEPSQSEISYGSTEAYGITSVDTNFVTDHSMVLASEALAPATSYHFKITNKDTAGNIASSSDSTFTTKGAVITVKVIGSSKQVLKGATVTLDKSTSIKTDKNGLVTFSSLSAGDHTVVATKDGKSSSATVNVTIPQNQPTYATLQLDVSPLNTLTVLLIVAALVVLALAIAKQLKKNKKVKRGHATHAAEDKTVSDNPKKHTAKHKKP